MPNNLNFELDWKACRIRMGKLYWLAAWNKTLFFNHLIASHTSVMIICHCPLLQPKARIGTMWREAEFPFFAHRCSDIEQIPVSAAKIALRLVCCKIFWVWTQDAWKVACNTVWQQIFALFSRQRCVYHWTSLFMGVLIMNWLMIFWRGNNERRMKKSLLCRSAEVI